MTRPRKPTALKELQGSFKPHPERRNKNEPVSSEEIGIALTTLSADEKKIWDEIKGIACDGVLTAADRIALELLCKLIHEMRYSFEDMNAAKLSRLTFLLSQFGMTPADRSKINIPQKKEKNVFEEYLN